MTLDGVLLKIKQQIESSVKTAVFDGQQKRDGLEAKEALIRSSTLINVMHEYIKTELIKNSVNQYRIFPPVGERNPEIKIAGFLKEKRQDIAVIPSKIPPRPRKITWGPLAAADKTDPFGAELAKRILTINVRSQLSSVEKNADTLFERTYAEALNLHELHPEMCLGEVFLIPLYEYDEEAMKENRVAFKKKRTNIEKYISFFNSISNRRDTADSAHKYERCALIIADFSLRKPRIYQNTEELKSNGLLPSDFAENFRGLDLEHFFTDLIGVYHQRFGAELLSGK